ncbi:sugar transporter [Tritonibacter mobilis]|uniref:sugar transporter n=1 Tax=Tritonibacter mobilis TaxID=379347 RepID=UPI001D0D7EF0|nr:sugar transporter [Tritonibacter mobilis]
MALVETTIDPNGICRDKQTKPLFQSEAVVTEKVTPIKAKEGVSDTSKAQQDSAPDTQSATPATAQEKASVAKADTATPSNPNSDKPHVAETADTSAMTEELEGLRKRAKSAEDKVEELNRKLVAPKTSPVARPARMKKRHWGVLASFLCMVMAPLLGVLLYLFVIAEDQYISSTGFTVRGQEGTSATDLLGGLAQFAGAGGSTGSDSAILYEYIQSQELVEKIDQELNLREHFSEHWPRDWAFALWPDATVEDLTWFWRRIVTIAYDSGSGLTEIQVTAYDREMAQSITQAIVRYSQERINALNDQAREDAMRYARADLDEALERLKVAREELIQFRTRTRIVDPEADIQGRMGVMNNLQQQLAEALVKHDLLRGSVSDDDPRLANSERVIDVIRERIDQERTNFASDASVSGGGAGEAYPSLISEFERLTVDRAFAEESYRVALTSLELARDEASRQSRYLATYISPTLAEDSQYPKRGMFTFLAGLMLLMSWAILVLIYYSVRDRR